MEREASDDLSARDNSFRPNYLSNRDVTKHLCEANLWLYVGLCIHAL